MPMVRTLCCLVLFLCAMSGIALAETTTLLCTNDGGYPGPRLEIDLDNRVIYVGTQRRKFSISVTERYITYVEHNQVGGEVSVLDIATGKHHYVKIGIGQSGKIISISSAVNGGMVCKKNLLD